jgi:hypothetical protein
MAYVLLVLLDRHRHLVICRARPVRVVTTPTKLGVTANSALNSNFRTQLERLHAKTALTDIFLTHPRQELSLIPKGRIAQVVCQGSILVAFLVIATPVDQDFQQHLGHRHARPVR